MDFIHQSVLLEEVIENLHIKPTGIYVDATLGGAGHAARIASLLEEGGTLIGIDQDEKAIITARERLQNTKPRVEIVKQNFTELGAILAEHKIEAIDGILFDLGVSSPQLDEDERGFSYKNDAPLDMRMDRSNPFSAAHLVNTASIDELTKILWEFGEERWSRRIALFIEKYRRDQPIETTGQLAAIIKNAIPAAARREGPHPARRSFQALRIAVNRELEVLQEALDQAINILKPGGRIAVISFHSLEDRLTKTALVKGANGCICPKDLPLCCCGQSPRLRIITKKPIQPSAAEVKRNPRARSAKLRAAEKL